MSFWVIYGGFANFGCHISKLAEWCGDMVIFDPQIGSVSGSVPVRVTCEQNIDNIPCSHNTGSWGTNWDILREERGGGVL